LKLINNLLVGPVRDGGCDIEIAKLQHSGRMKAFFPLHEDIMREKILLESVDWNSLPWGKFMILS
jgi:hypothetical protein